RKKFRAGDQRHAIRMDTVHQHHRALAGLASDEPAMNGGAAVAGEGDVLRVQIGRGIADWAVGRGHQEAAHEPYEDGAKDGSSENERAKFFPPPGEFHLPFDMSD